MSTVLASYASDPRFSRGRLYKELPTSYRNEFERDRDRVIRSNAFRRAQYKTQIFINHEGDHYRNRLTHSVEVSTVARSIAKELNLAEALAETVALAHDIGHTPFGHAGEEVLNICMKDYGGFSHNTHALKLITILEERYAAYSGLNLTWETLEGVVKHNGPLTDGKIDEYIMQYNDTNNLELNLYPSSEAQIASLADDITYICHDLEDAIRANIINFKDLSDIDLVNNILNDMRAKFIQDISNSRLIYEVTRKLMHILITDLLQTSKDNFIKYNIETLEDIRLLDRPVIDFSKEIMSAITNIKQFLLANVYRHRYVASINIKCKKVVQSLFTLYMNNANLLPQYDAKKLQFSNDKSKALLVSDYIAGMTDRFAISEYQLYHDLTFNNI
ncbi:MAG: deoxyguanosinetriphosphate triphosphohydrolase [Rickettsiaceae bacterium]